MAEEVLSGPRERAEHRRDQDPRGDGEERVASRHDEGLTAARVQADHMRFPPETADQSARSVRVRVDESR